MSQYIERETDISEADRAMFWDLVKIALLILRADLSLYDRYRPIHDASPESQRILNYHSCPLNLAADLAGGDRPTEAQYAVYIPIEAHFYGKPLP